MLLYILLAIAGLSLLIFVHELGHFVAGKLFGVKVNEFMLGLPGPKLAKVKRGESTYGVTVLLFGGYVKFAGMDPTEELSPEDEARGFDAQPLWKRLLILAAGPAFNLLLAVLIFTGIFMYGVPAPTTTIATVLKDYPAAKARLVPGDRIEAINGRAIRSWDELIETVRAAPNKQVTLRVSRDGRVRTVRPTLTTRNDVGFLGIGPKIADQSFGFLQSVWLAVRATAIITAGVVVFLVELPQRLSLLQQARGPLGVVQESVKAAQSGLRDFMWLVAAFSISLGVFNLLPIPPLDGGKVLLGLVEGAMRKKLNKNVVLAVSAVGASLLVMLMIYIVVADIGRLLPGGAGG